MGSLTERKMFKGNGRRHVFEKNPSLNKEREIKPTRQGFMAKNLKKVYPLGMHKTGSSLSLSSLSLTSQNSNDSSLRGSIVLGDWKIPVSRREPIGSPKKREKPPVHVPIVSFRQPRQSNSGDNESLKRCQWITKSTDEIYVQYHDERWGVPVYDDHQLFELLALSGMLMYQFWADILKRKELYREAFGGFDPNVVAKMNEKEIREISSNRALVLAENQVRCIVDNAKCILKIVKEYGSFSSYLWGYMNYQPMINRFRYAKSLPLRSPKAETISTDLRRRGFRFVGPVIVYSFMQAAGMTMDHLAECFRFSECVSIAENGPWRQD